MSLITKLSPSTDGWAQGLLIDIDTNTTVPMCEFWNMLEAINFRILPDRLESKPEFSYLMVF